MLELFVTPKHGNAGGRYFPHTGYLGVTPVVIQGTAVTRLPSFCAPLPVKRITLRVKCIEHRSGGAFESDVDHTLYEVSQTLFELPAGEHQEYTEMGEWDAPFRLSIPPEAVIEGRSAMNIREYKVTWRMEVVVDHKPIPYVGNSISKAFALDLQNHRSPSLPPLSPPLPVVVGTESYATEVSLGVAHGSYGPGDTFNVAVNTRSNDLGAHIKKVSMVLERVIEFMDVKSHDSSSSSSQEGRRQSPSPPSKISSIFRRSTSPRPPPPLQRIPSDPPALDESTFDSRHVAIRDKIAEASSSDITSGSPGAYRCTMSLSLPRRTGKWDLGESHRSKLVAISYQLRVSISIKPKAKSTAKSFTCPPVPISLVSASAEDRATAASFAGAGGTAHEKKRHRSSRRGLYMHEGNTDVSDPAIRSHHSHSHRHRHRASRSRSTSPVLFPIKGVATDVKPILLPSGHTAQAQSISFIFPSRQDQDSSSISIPSQSEASTPNITPNSYANGNRNSVQIPIHSLLHPTYSPPKSTSTSSSTSTLQQLPSPPPTRAGAGAGAGIGVGVGVELDIWRRVQETGRRISTTTSEEEEVQPSRSRQRTSKVSMRSEVNQEEFAKFEIKTSTNGGGGGGGCGRPALPSLDALGLGLPHVPDTARPIRRPRTAPVHSTFSMYRNNIIPPPLSGTIPPPLSGHGHGQLEHLAPPPNAQIGTRPVTSIARIPSNTSITSPTDENNTFAFSFTPAPATVDEQ